MASSLLPAQPPSRLFTSPQTPKTSATSFPLHHFRKPNRFKAIPEDDPLLSIIDNNPDMPESVKIAFAKAAAYRSNKLLKENEEAGKVSEASGTSSDDPLAAMPESVRLAFAKAAEYRKNKITKPSEGVEKPLEASGTSSGDSVQDSNVPELSNLQPRTEQSENLVEAEDGAMQDSRISEGLNGKIPR